MAQIRIEEIMDHLDSEMKSALRATLAQHYPNQNVDANTVYRTFKRKVASKFGSWVRVPDNFISKE